VGRGNRRSRNLYRIVAEAQRQALKAVKPGVPAAAVDAAARSVIEKAGYGDAFGHATGHGVGLEVHEGPSVSARSGDLLERGMVFTVEPGIYVEHFGGVRIEDMVLVTGSGCEILTKSVPKRIL
jgi:Xaa-Pro aminopeptidase